jgi:hypothetical protein
MWLLFQASVPYSLVAFRGHTSLRGSSHNIVPTLSLTTVSPLRDVGMERRANRPRQQPTSSGTHHCPGSVSSAVSEALRVDAGPHNGPPVLQ